MSPRRQPLVSSGHYCVATREGTSRCGFCGAPVAPIPPLNIAPKPATTTEGNDR